jgi:ferredoxin
LGLVASVREKASHWPDGSVHWEPFTPEPAENTQENEAFEVVLSRRNIRLPVTPEKTILETVREAGVEIESSCEDGLCGCCRIRLLGGVPEHRDLVLTDAERESSKEIMICISRAKAGEVLVLDI